MEVAAVTPLVDTAQVDLEVDTAQVDSEVDTAQVDLEVATMEDMGNNKCLFFPTLVPLLNEKK